MAKPEDGIGIMPNSPCPRSQEKENPAWTWQEGLPKENEGGILRKGESWMPSRVAARVQTLCLPTPEELYKR